MNRPKYIKHIFTDFILIIIVCFIPANNQPVVNAQNQSSDIGRDNPFAKITRISKPMQALSRLTLRLNSLCWKTIKARNVPPNNCIMIRTMG